MNTYLVTWEITIDAESPKEAAEKALSIQRNPSSIATVFSVEDLDTDEQSRIDLEEVYEAVPT